MPGRGLLNSARAPWLADCYGISSQTGSSPPTAASLSRLPRSRSEDGPVHPSSSRLRTFHSRGGASTATSSPFRSFAHNQVWLFLVMAAQDLVAWTQALCLPDQARAWSSSGCATASFTSPGGSPATPAKRSCASRATGPSPVSSPPPSRVCRRCPPPRARRRRPPAGVTRQATRASHPDVGLPTNGRHTRRPSQRRGRFTPRRPHAAPPGSSDRSEGPAAQDETLTASSPEPALAAGSRPIA